MPATPQTRAELEDLLVAYISDPLNKQNSAAAAREVIRAVFNSSYNRADDPLNPSTPPGAASYGTITGVPEDSPSLNNRLSTIRALASRSPNRAANNTKAVKWLTNADREAAGGTDADGETAEDSFPLHTAGTNPLNLGTVFRAESGLEGVLVYDDGTNTDPAIPRLANVFRDGGQTVAGQPAMLVLVDSVEAAGANIRVIDNVIADWGLNETGKIIIGGSYAYFGTNAAGGPFTPPTALAGNANWHPEAEPLAPNQFYQPISVATAQSIALADTAIHPITYRILRGSDGTRRRGDVVVQGIAFSPGTEAGEADVPARFATDGLWLNPDMQEWVRALYDVVTDTVVPLDFSHLSPVSVADASAGFRGFATLADAAANMDLTDAVISTFQNQEASGVDLGAAAALRGNGVLLGGDSGTLLPQRVSDVTLVGIPLNGALLNCAVADCAVPATFQAAFAVCGITYAGSRMVIAGTVRLRVGTTVPANFFDSFTRNADGSYTTPDGGTVIDEREAAGAYNVPTALQIAVAAGTYTNGELTGTQPAGSAAGMKFYDTTHTYEYFGTKWIRCPKA